MQKSSYQRRYTACCEDYRWFSNESATDKGVCPLRGLNSYSKDKTPFFLASRKLMLHTRILIATQRATECLHRNVQNRPEAKRQTLRSRVYVSDDRRRNVMATLLSFSNPLHVYPKLSARVSSLLITLVQAVAVPLAGIVVFLFLWSVTASKVDTSLGKFPGPDAVWEQMGNLYLE